MLQVTRVGTENGNIDVHFPGSRLSRFVRHKSSPGRRRKRQLTPRRRGKKRTLPLWRAAAHIAVNGVDARGVVGTSVVTTIVDIHLTVVAVETCNRQPDMPAVELVPAPHRRRIPRRSSRQYYSARLTEPCSKVIRIRHGARRLTYSIVCLRG